MKTKFIISLFLTAALFSCKQETKPKEITPETPVVSEVMKVTLDLTFPKDDSFHLYFTEDGSSNFTEESSIWVEVKGSPESQLVVFNFPENTIPTQMRIDFGVNKEQGDILIKNFKMDYKGKTFEAPGSLFFNYFGPNEKITKIDREKGIIMPVKTGDQYFGPSFYPMPTLSEQITKLVK